MGEPNFLGAWAGETLVAFSRVIPCKSPYPIGASCETPDHADDLGYRILYLDTPSGAHALPDGKCAGISMSIMVSCGKKTTLGLGNVAGKAHGRSFISDHGADDLVHR